MSNSASAVPRSVVVTGGASGFGLSIALALLRQGARVAIGDIDARRIRDAREALHGLNALFLDLDVTSQSSVRQAIETSRASFGGLDTLVNSAGIIQFARLADITGGDWDRVLDVNLKGAFLCAQAAAPSLCASGRGRIVNIGSDASKVGFPWIAPYCASKSGLIGLTKALACELAPDHVTVNCVCPVGVSDTGMGEAVLKWKKDATGKLADEILSATARSIPLQRNATVADVVNGVLFFLNDASSFLTGVALDVDGGSLSMVAMPGLGD